MVRKVRSAMGAMRDASSAVWWTLLMARIVAAGIACLSNPCLHGICIDDVNSTYSCYCVDGYTGVQCQTNWDECWSSPCENGGTCIDGIASFNCSCPDGFIGDNCETNYNECESNPCQNNGTCIDMTNGYVCSCVPGFAGDHCEVDIAVCNSSEEVRCYNGGHCIEGSGFKFFCRCLPGWGGAKCEDPIDECQSNPCQNGGICIDVHADYMCACTFGRTGKNCEVQIEFCDESTCSNNALCLLEDELRVCYCVPDYHGERCELQYNECLLGPGCLNGGTCIDGVDNFTCSCPPQLTGSMCECLILQDGSHDCKYVSPTTLRTTTQSVLLTTIQSVLLNTMHETWATPEIISLNSSTLFIDTTTSFYTTASESETWTVLPEEKATIDKDTDVETTTDVITYAEPSVTLPVNELVTGITDTTTTEPEVTAVNTVAEPKPGVTNKVTTVNTITETTSIETSESVRTTVCGETCNRVSTDSNVPLPEMDHTFSTTPISTEELTEGKETIEWTTESIINTSDYQGRDESTPKVDGTTVKLFTETPTEHILTDTSQTTPFYVYTSSTTEGVETTIFDNATSVIAQSECSESICNGHGTCINTPQGRRCHCSFQFTGKFCDERVTINSAAFGGNSYIAQHLLNATTIDVEFDAKTLISDGQIMFADIAKGVYMQLYISSGLLKFKFSCGYQTMLLSELKTYVNNGHSMKIETRLDLNLENQHCNATLRLNDTVAMSGGQVANISSLDHNTTLYLGNTPNNKDLENKPFIGCIKDLKLNGDQREMFGDSFDVGDISECSSLSCLSGPCLNGGSCRDYGENYTCSCANGWMGDHCERSFCEHNPCQFGGSCVIHPGSGFLCLCPYGKHGIFCEYNVEITRPSIAVLAAGTSSYLMYPLSPLALNSERFDLRLRFQADDMDQIALLAFVGQNGHHDARSQHLAVTFVKGYIMLTWNLGSGPRRIFTPRPLSERRSGHTIRVGRRGRTAWLSVDSRFNVSGNSPGPNMKMTALPYVFIGGHPSLNFQDLPHDLPLHTGWRGCVWDIGGQAIGSGKAIGGRGVGQCGVAQCTAKSCNAPRGVCIHTPAAYGCMCNEGWFGATCATKQNPCDRAFSHCEGRCVVTASSDAQCDCPYGKTGFYCEKELFPTDVLFTGLRSFVRLVPHPVSSVKLALEAEIKPIKARGLMIFAYTPHFYTALSLQGGLLEYRWTDRLSGMTSLVRSGVVVSMGQWHNVKAGRYGSRLYVWVDGALSTEAMLAHAYPHTASNSSIVLGGAADLSKLPVEVMSGPPESYTGCIRNLQVNNVMLPLEKQNIEEGLNLADCDGTACGGEACGGGNCVIEDGQARCACGAITQTLNGSGARCRRDTPCKPSTCAPPKGTCRKGSCVCSAGYGGINCEDRINVTIPQFRGDSFLSLLRKASPSDSRIGEQRVGTLSSQPMYISLNFTTAEKDGLLVWRTMNNDYLGMGLENGYLKLVWSFRQDNASHERMGETYKEIIEKPRNINKALPHVGFLADGEWHVVELRMDRTNVTLIVDQFMAYAEEPGLSGGSEYHGDIDLFLGGIPDDVSSVAKRAFPRNFNGCIDNVWISEEGPFDSNYSEAYSENINSCQLFP